MEEDSHIFLCAAGGLAFREPPPSFLHQLYIWVGLAASVGNFHGTPSFHLLATLTKIKLKLKHKAVGYARQAAHLQQVEGRTLRQANSH